MSIAIETNLDYILEAIAERKSAETISDELAFKGILIEPKEINGYLRENNISRERPNKGSRFIAPSTGSGSDGIYRGQLNLSKNR